MSHYATNTEFFLKNLKFGLHRVWYLFDHNWNRGLRYPIIFIFSAFLLFDLQILLNYIYNVQYHIDNGTLIYWPILFSFEELLKIIAVFFVILLLLWIFKFRTKLIVEEFQDFSKDKKKENDDNIVFGLNTLLIAEINRLNKLYQDVDNKRSIPSIAGSTCNISASFKVDDVNEALQGVISSNQNITLGPLTVPVGLFLSVLSPLIKGQKILGGVHKGEKEYIVTAFLVGGEKPISWRVECEYAKNNKDEKNTTSEKNNPTNEENTTNEENDFFKYKEKLIEDLACKIFTDLNDNISNRWEAVNLFNKGLEKYRKCLCTPITKDKNLKKAENEFISALACDNTFNLAWYNLGVVYNELEHYNAAASTFLKGILHNPKRWESYYAYALTKYQIKSTEIDQYSSDVIPYCEQAEQISKELEKENSSILNLKGLAYLEMAHPELMEKTEEQYREFIKNINNAIVSFRAASDIAWKDYCTYNIYKHKTDDFSYQAIYNPKKIALSECLCNLAWSYLIYGVNDKKLSECYWDISESYFKQSIKLDHYNNETHWRLGVLYLLKASLENTPGEYIKEAAGKFREADRINPKSFKHKMSLALSHALDNFDEEGKFESSFIKSLPYSINAFRLEEEGKDHQWKEIGMIYNFLCELYVEKQEKSKIDTQINKNSQKSTISSQSGSNKFVQNCEMIPELYEFIRHLDNLDKEIVQISSENDYLYLNKSFKDKFSNLTLYKKKIEELQDNKLLDYKNWLWGHGCYINAIFYYNEILFGEKCQSEEKIKNSRFKCTYKLLKNCEKCFEKFPEEIENRSISHYLSDIESKQEKVHNALIGAINVHWQDPTSPLTHELLSKYYYFIRDYENAIEIMREAQKWGHEKPKPHNQNIIALSSFYWGECYKDKDIKKEKIQNAIESSKNMLFLLELELQKEDKKNQGSKIVKNIAEIHYNIGIYYYQLCNYAEQIYQFNVALSLFKSLQKEGKLEIVNRIYWCQLHLGNAFIKTKNFADAESQYNEIIEGNVKNKLNKIVEEFEIYKFKDDERKFNKIIEKFEKIKFRDDSERNIIAYAYQDRVRTYIERNLKIGKCKEELINAENIINEIKDEEIIQPLKSSQKLYEGLIKLKLELDPIWALSLFEESIDYYPYPDTYVFMIQAIEMILKLKLKSKTKEKNKLIYQAQEYHKLATELDYCEEYKSYLEKIIDEIKKY